jgi:hypothetical protein
VCCDELAIRLAALLMNGGKLGMSRDATTLSRGSRALR